MDDLEEETKAAAANMAADHRRSERKRKDPRPVFSPDDFASSKKVCPPTSDLSASPKKKKKRLSRRSIPSASAADRPYDVLPDGTPFSCDLCQSPYVCNPLLSKAGSRVKRSRHMPSPQQKVNPVTGKLLTLCNACGRSLDRPRPSKTKVRPSQEEKEAFLAESRSFANSIAAQLQDTDAERLYCPSFQNSACGCLQNYITGSEDEEGVLDRARELLDLYKEARKLSTEKVYSLDKADAKSADKKRKRSGSIGLGNGMKRSRRFEAFILEKRVSLKRDLQLCERAVQRILCYSNNFLHKKLKTEERGSRVVRQKGKAALGLLEPLDKVATYHCCVDKCIRMVHSHRNLLQQWRKRAMASQSEARRVLAEMLTPSGGVRSNCYKFISWVTGCSNSTIGKVRDQMRRTKGDREPPQHGLYSYWQQKGHNQSKGSGPPATMSQDETDTGDVSGMSLSGMPAGSSQVVDPTFSSSSTAQQFSSGASSGSQQQQQQLMHLQQQLVQQQAAISQQQQQVQQQMLTHSNMQQLSWSHNASSLASIQQQLLMQMSQLQTAQQQLAQTIQTLQQQLALAQSSHPQLALGQHQLDLALPQLMQHQPQQVMQQFGQTQSVQVQQYLPSQTMPQQQVLTVSNIQQQQQQQFFPTPSSQQQQLGVVQPSHHQLPWPTQQQFPVATGQDVQGWPQSGAVVNPQQMTPVINTQQPVTASSQQQLMPAIGSQHPPTPTVQQFVQRSAIEQQSESVGIVQTSHQQHFQQNNMIGQLQSGSLSLGQPNAVPTQPVGQVTSQLTSGSVQQFGQQVVLTLVPHTQQQQQQFQGQSACNAVQMNPSQQVQLVSVSKPNLQPNVQTMFSNTSVHSVQPSSQHQAVVSIAHGSMTQTVSASGQPENVTQAGQVLRVVHDQPVTVSCTSLPVSGVVNQSGAATYPLPVTVRSQAGPPTQQYLQTGSMTVVGQSASSANSPVVEIRSESQPSPTVTTVGVQSTGVMRTSVGGWKHQPGLVTNGTSQSQTAWHARPLQGVRQNKHYQSGPMTVKKLLQQRANATEVSLSQSKTVCVADASSQLVTTAAQQITTCIDTLTQGDIGEDGTAHMPPIAPVSSVACSLQHQTRLSGSGEQSIRGQPSTAVQKKRISGTVSISSASCGTPSVTLQHSPLTASSVTAASSVTHVPVTMQTSIPASPRTVVGIPTLVSDNSVSVRRSAAVVGGVAPAASKTISSNTPTLVSASTLKTVCTAAVSNVVPVMSRPVVSCNTPILISGSPPKAVSTTSASHTTTPNQVVITLPIPSSLLMPEQRHTVGTAPVLTPGLRVNLRQAAPSVTTQQQQLQRPTAPQGVATSIPLTVLQHVLPVKGLGTVQSPASSVPVIACSVVATAPGVTSQSTASKVSASSGRSAPVALSQGKVWAAVQGGRNTTTPSKAAPVITNLSSAPVSQIPSATSSGGTSSAISHSAVLPLSTCASSSVKNASFGDSASNVPAETGAVSSLRTVPTLIVPSAESPSGRSGVTVTQSAGLSLSHTEQSQLGQTTAVMPSAATGHVGPDISVKNSAPATKPAASPKKGKNAVKRASRAAESRKSAVTTVNATVQTVPPSTPHLPTTHSKHQPVQRTTSLPAPAGTNNSPMAIPVGAGTPSFIGTSAEFAESSSSVCRTKPSFSVAGVGTVTSTTLYQTSSVTASTGLVITSSPSHSLQPAASKHCVTTAVAAPDHGKSLSETSFSSTLPVQIFDVTVSGSNMAQVVTSSTSTSGEHGRLVGNNTSAVTPPVLGVNGPQHTQHMAVGKNRAPAGRTANAAKSPASCGTHITSTGGSWVMESSVHVQNASGHPVHLRTASGHPSETSVQPRQTFVKPGVRSLPSLSPVAGPSSVTGAPQSAVVAINRGSLGGTVDATVAVHTPFAPGAMQQSRAGFTPVSSSAGTGVTEQPAVKKSMPRRGAPQVKSTASSRGVAESTTHSVSVASRSQPSVTATSTVSSHPDLGFPVSFTPVVDNANKMVCITSPMNFQQLQALLQHMKVPPGTGIVQITPPAAPRQHGPSDASNTPPGSAAVVPVPSDQDRTSVKQQNPITLSGVSAASGVAFRTKVPAVLTSTPSVPSQSTATAACTENSSPLLHAHSAAPRTSHTVTHVSSARGDGTVDVSHTSYAVSGTRADSTVDLPHAVSSTRGDGTVDVPHTSHAVSGTRGNGTVNMPHTSHVVSGTRGDGTAGMPHTSRVVSGTRGDGTAGMPHTSHVVSGTRGDGTAGMPHTSHVVSGTRGDGTAGMPHTVTTISSARGDGTIDIPRTLHAVSGTRGDNTVDMPHTSHAVIGTRGNSATYLTHQTPGLSLQHGAENSGAGRDSESNVTPASPGVHATSRKTFTSAQEHTTKKSSRRPDSKTRPHKTTGVSSASTGKSRAKKSQVIPTRPSADENTATVPTAETQSTVHGPPSVYQSRASAHETQTHTGFYSERPSLSVEGDENMDRNAALNSLRPIQPVYEGSPSQPPLPAASAMQECDIYMPDCHSPTLLEMRPVQPFLSAPLPPAVMSTPLSQSVMAAQLQQPGAASSLPVGNVAVLVGPRPSPVFDHPPFIAPQMERVLPTSPSRMSEMDGDDTDLLSVSGFQHFISSSSSRSRNSSGASSIEPSITIDPASLPFDLMQMVQQGLTFAVAEVAPMAGGDVDTN